MNYHYMIDIRPDDKGTTLKNNPIYKLNDKRINLSYIVHPSLGCAYINILVSKSISLSLSHKRTYRHHLRRILELIFFSCIQYSSAVARFIICFYLGLIPFIHFKRRRKRAGGYVYNDILLLHNKSTTKKTTSVNAANEQHRYIYSV